MTSTNVHSMIDWQRYQALTLDRRDDGVLVITIGEPEGRPTSSGLRRRQEIMQVWRDFADDPDLKVAVITGRGDRFWPLGGVTEMLEDPANFDKIANLLHEAVTNVRSIVDCDKPVVSAINGHAMGTGLVLGLLADVSIAAEDAQLLDGHLLQGLAAGDHSVLIWPLLCGMAKAKYYLMASEHLTGREAERIGLVSAALPQDQVLDKALEIAHRLATAPPYALRWTKRTLNYWLRSATPAFEASLAFEGLTFFSPDFVEALTASTQDRAPRFSEPTAW